MIQHSLYYAFKHCAYKVAEMASANFYFHRYSHVGKSNAEMDGLLIPQFSLVDL